jgi:hypothetical protein
VTHRVIFSFDQMAINVPRQTSVIVSAFLDQAAANGRATKTCRSYILRRMTGTSCGFNWSAQHFDL